MAEKSWDSLNQFRFARFKFNIRALNFFPFSAYWDQNFRDDFKASFKSTTCSQDENCAGCGSKKNCPYLYVFKTPFPSQPSKKAEYLSPPPHPFIISPPLDRTRNYDCGENFTMEITLIGNAAEYLSGFISALKKMGQIGLGMENSKFVIESVESSGIFEKPKIIFDGEGEKPLCDFEIFSGQKLIEAFNPEKSDEAAIEFQTPIRIKHDPKLKSSLYFFIFFRNLVTRLASLSRYCSTEIDFFAKGLTDRSHWVRTKENNLFQVNLERDFQGPGTAQRTIDLTGSIVYMGALEELFPFLVLGQYLHVGKEATYGFGKYSIVEG